MESTAMIAHFPDQGTRDEALKKALEKGLQVGLVGDAGLVVEGKGPSPPFSFVLFKETMLDGLKFMQYNASFCGPLYLG